MPLRSGHRFQNVVMLKILVNVLRIQKLVNLQMDLVDNLPVVKYWSVVLFFTIVTHLSDLEVKVMDFKSSF